MTMPEQRDVEMVSLLWAGVDMAAEISQLHCGLFDDGWDPLAVARLLENPGATTLIARTGFPKASVGFIMGQIAADEAEILSIGVSREWQRKGLGKKLLNGLERALIRAGVKRLHLEVADDNAPARALYTRMDFAETGRRKGYYARKGASAVDALILSKAL